MAIVRGVRGGDYLIVMLKFGYHTGSILNRSFFSVRILMDTEPFRLPIAVFVIPLSTPTIFIFRNSLYA